jgi:hypothetical protein
VYLTTKYDVSIHLELVKTLSEICGLLICFIFMPMPCSKMKTYCNALAIKLFILVNIFSGDLKLTFYYFMLHIVLISVLMYDAVFMAVVPGFDLPNENGARNAGCWVEHIMNSSGSLGCNEKPVSSADVHRASEPARKWDPEISQLVASEKWLEMHGLKRAKLDMYSLLRQMGFRHANGRHCSSFH